jgi:monovalent cation:H+ antiporter, CPA1 family
MASSRRVSVKLSPRLARFAGNIWITRRSRGEIRAPISVAKRNRALSGFIRRGLISTEVYQDLTSRVEHAQNTESPPRFDIGLDTRDLVGRLGLFEDLDNGQLESVRKLLRPRFTVPKELIVRKGDPGESMFFIASGAVEVALPESSIPLRSGDVFGEMALLTGAPRQADVRALTYCRLLVLRKADFDRFMRENGNVRLKIYQIAETRASVKTPDAAKDDRP